MPNEELKEITEEVRTQVRSAFIEGQRQGPSGRLPAIKALRLATGMGLKASLALLQEWESEGFLPRQEYGEGRALNEAPIRRVREEIPMLARRLSDELGVEARFVYAEIVYHSTRLARQGSERGET